MICDACTEHGKKAVGVFSNLERMYILTSCVNMLRSVTNEKDKVVANSVVTKMLLSYDEASRYTLQQFLRQSLGMEISVQSCPHGKLALV